MTASFTEKLMTIAISFFSMTTTRATLRGIPGLNFNNFKAVSLSLVGRKLFELISGPFVNVFALFFSQIATVGNTLESFYRYGGIAGFSGKFDNPPGDNVHRISGKPRLLSALPFQNTPNRARVSVCLLPLETGAGCLITTPDMLQASTIKELYTFAIGHSGNIVYTPIHADNGVIGLVNQLDSLFKRNCQIDLAALDKQATVAHSPVGVSEIVLQLWRSLIGNAFNPTVNGGYAQTVLAEAKVTASDSTLQANSGVPKSNRLRRFLFGLSEGKVFGRYLPVGAYQDLRGQIKLCFQVLIGQLVEFSRIADIAIFKGDTAGIVANVVPFLNGALCKVFIKPDFEFNRSGNIHDNIIAQLLEESKSIFSGGIRRNSPPGF